MKVFIWHHIFPDYEYRLKLMGDRACLIKARRAAYDQLALVPKE